MRNERFIDNWVRFPTNEGHANNVSAVNFKLYSYNTCICQAVIIDGKFEYIANRTKYSITTSKHQHYLMNALDRYGKDYSVVENVERNKNRLI